MGYDVHITRRQQWFDSDKPEITIEEWLALVASDSEMRLDGSPEAMLPDGGTLRHEDPSLAVWVRYSGHMVGRNMAWLWLWRGNIVAKNPDEEIRSKMWRLAQALHARVQGDELELYGSDGQPLEDLQTDRTPVMKRTWWRFWQ